MATDITGLDTSTTTRFEFDTVRRTLTVFESDFVRFILVINRTKGQNIFNINETQFKGRQNFKTLTFDYDVSSMASDDIIVVYERFDKSKSILNEILEEHKKSNKFFEILISTVR